MGFYLRCAITKVDDDAVADAIAAHMTGLFPSFVTVRRFAAPFAGVIAGYDYNRTHEDIVARFAAHGYPDEDAASEDAYGAIDNRMPQLSSAFAARPFAYVNVDCFGGTCMYDGYVVKDGEVLHSEPFSSASHVRLFEYLGVRDAQWHFAPFTRGFMETGEAAADARLPTTFYVQARWDESFRLAAIRATMLPPPWKVTLMTERDCVVTYGDQFVASLNTVDDHVELRGQSYTDLTHTRTLAGELADDDVALELKDPDGKLL
jgi:hypothetical protein